MTFCPLASGSEPPRERRDQNQGAKPLNAKRFNGQKEDAQPRYGTGADGKAPKRRRWRMQRGAFEDAAGELPAKAGKATFAATVVAFLAVLKLDE